MPHTRSVASAAISASGEVVAAPGSRLPAAPGSRLPSAPGPSALPVPQPLIAIAAHASNPTNRYRPATRLIQIRLHPSRRAQGVQSEIVLNWRVWQCVLLSALTRSRTTFLRQVCEAHDAARLGCHGGLVAQSLFAQRSCPRLGCHSVSLATICDDYLQSERRARARWAGAIASNRGLGFRLAGAAGAARRVAQIRRSAGVAGVP